MNKLVIMAGGTGGHVFPGLAVAHKMQSLGWQIDWIGTADKMEAQLVPEHGFPIHFIDIGGVRGKSVLTKLLTPIKLCHAVIQAFRLLRQIKPAAVLGMGGYASGPGGLAAYLLGIPIIIHEQNAVFGMTNRYLTKLATATLSGFDLSNSQNATSKSIQAKFVGNPIREAFFQIPALSTISRENNAVNVLIVGGSLGALALNENVPPILNRLSKSLDINVRHQSGKGKLDALQNAYSNECKAELLEFLPNIQDDFAWADVIICRAGALTVAEVAGAGRAAIFVPLPIAVDDHQTANAKNLSDKQAAVLLAQKDIDSGLEDILRKLCTDKNYRIEMAAKARQCAISDATVKVASVIIENTPQRSSKEPS